MEFCFIDVNDMVVKFQSWFFFLYLIDANVNHENWIDGFSKSIYYIILQGICIFLFFFWEGETK